MCEPRQCPVHLCWAFSSSFIWKFPPQCDFQKEEPKTTCGTSWRRSHKCSVNHPHPLKISPMPLPNLQGSHTCSIILCRKLIFGLPRSGPQTLKGWRESPALFMVELSLCSFLHPDLSPVLAQGHVFQKPSWFVLISRPPWCSSKVLASANLATSALGTVSRIHHIVEPRSPDRK